MSANTVCRVCLANNLNLHGVRNYLRNVYERITREEYNKDGYPLSMCYICLSALRKCHRFMETAQVTNDVLKDWYIDNQQTERVAKPLYMYSKSKVDIVSISEKTLLECDIKKEILDVEFDKLETECEFGVDIRKTDIDEQTDVGDVSLVSNIYYDDTIEGNDDGQTDPLSHCNAVEEKSSLTANVDVLAKIGRKKNITTPNDGAPSVKKRKTISTNPQHAVPGTSRDTAANSETCKDFTSLKLGLIETTSIKSEAFNNNNIIKIEYNPESTTNCGTSKNITSLNSLPAQSDNITEIKPTFAITNLKNTTKILKVIPITSTSVEFDSNRNDPAKLIKVIKVNTIPKNIKTSSLKNKNNLIKLAIKPAGTSKMTKPVINPKVNIDDNNTKAKLAKQLQFCNRRKSYVCDVCGSAFRTLSTLNVHKDLTHSAKIKELNCGLCDFKTKFHAKMKVHLNAHASICSICHRQCLSRADLVCHMRTHTGERPFSCHICDRTFKQKYDVKFHISNVHGVKRFTCQICGYKCSQKGTLDIHLRTHTGEKPFACNICDHKTISKTRLNIHMRTHTDKRSFSCKICDYKCANASKLKLHMQIHTGEKSNLCTTKRGTDVCVRVYVK